MTYIPPRLVDSSVKGFIEWRAALEEEDRTEFGTVIRGSPRALRQLYEMYLAFQCSEPVVRARQYLYAPQQPEVKP